MGALALDYGAKKRYVDVHIHLYDPLYGSTIEAVLKDAETAGVSAIVICAENYKTSLATLQIARKYSPRTYAAIGIHPSSVSFLDEHELDKTLSLIEQNLSGIVAIGEVGLDRRLNEGEINKNQFPVFNEMLRAAESHDLPIIVHSRGSAAEVLKVLSSYNIPKVLLHWYSGPQDSLQEVIERGYYVSVGPSILYARYLQDLVATMPLDHILTETDGPVPYKGPFKGRLTSPSFIPDVLDTIVRIKQRNAEEVLSQVFENFQEFFSLNSVHKLSQSL